jgi:Zn-dependent M28 family amino/carboxypeptidase
LDYRPEAVVIIDMVGDQDLEVYLEMNSDQALCADIWDSAEQLDLQKYFNNQVKYSLIDDHSPFIEQEIPACLLIDFDYPYWHTTQDTPDKVSAESLQNVGDILNHWINKNKPD